MQSFGVHTLLYTAIGFVASLLDSIVGAGGGFISPSLTEKLSKEGTLRIFLGVVLCVAAVRMLVSSLTSML